MAVAGDIPVIAGTNIKQRRNSIPFTGGNRVKPSTRDRISGKVHEVKGAIKQKAGKLTNNPNLEAEGQGEKVGGKIRKKIGQVEKVLGT